jgi:PAS domain-containing protein
MRVSQGCAQRNPRSRCAKECNLSGLKNVVGRKKAEEALRQSEERFAAFMDNLPGYAWMKDLQGRYV